MQLDPQWLYLPEYVYEEFRRCQAAVEPGLFTTGLIVDANNVMYRLAFAASRDVSTPEDMLAVFVESVKKTAEGISADLTVCAIDYGVSLRRSMLGATKKPNKTPEQEAVIDMARGALKLIREYQGPQWLNPRWMDGYEADDIAAAFAVSGLCVHTVVYSTDSDIYQVTNGNAVTQLSPATKKYVKFEIPQEMVPGVKALAGDSSDNVEGIKGIGTKTALDVLTGKKTVDLTPEEILRVRNNLDLTCLPFPGSCEVFSKSWFSAFATMPAMYEEVPAVEDDETVPF